MNDLAAPFRQLVERRLWPLAVLLLAVLAAIPVMLAKSAGSGDLPPATAVGASVQGSTEPVVALGDEAAREAARKVLGSRKDPFRPAIKAKKAKVSAADTASTSADTGGSSAGDTSSGGGAVAVTPGTSIPAGPITPSTTYELYSLRVRFGSTSDPTLTAGNLKRLKALPSAEDPALIYLGLLDDKKTAVFLVDANAKVQGDGKCLPDPGNCQTLHLKRGDTAFIDVTTAEGQATQYQLDLVRIRTSKTTDAKAATASYAAESKAGRGALRARVSRVGRLRYDTKSGMLKKISPKAWKAAAAGAAAASAG